MIIFAAGVKWTPAPDFYPMVLLVRRLRGENAGKGEEYLSGFGHQASVSAVLECCEECSYSGYHRLPAPGLMQFLDGAMQRHATFHQHQGEVAGALFYWERRQGDDVSATPACYLENITITVGSPPAPYDLCVAIPGIRAL